MTDEETNSIDLEDIFFLYGRTTKRYILKLSPKILSITLKQDDSANRTSTENSTQLIPIDDIYGCICAKSNKNPTQCHLILHLYTLRQAHGISGVFSKKLNLYRSQKTFAYGQYPDYERNSAEVIRWHRHVKHAIYLKQNLPGKFK
jgi:hypothetical protein